MFNATVVQFAAAEVKLLHLNLGQFAIFTLGPALPLHNYHRELYTYVMVQVVASACL